MNGAPTAVLVAAAAALCLAAMAAAAPAGAWRRALAAALAAALLVAAGAAASALLGRPRATELPFANTRQSWLEVSYADWKEGEGIYVLVRGPGGGAPRLYVLPWRRALAEQLRTAAAAAEERGGLVRMANILGKPEDELAETLVFVRWDPLR